VLVGVKVVEQYVSECFLQLQTGLHKSERNLLLHILIPMLDRTVKLNIRFFFQLDYYALVSVFTTPTQNRSVWQTFVKLGHHDG